MVIKGSCLQMMIAKVRISRLYQENGQIPIELFVSSLWILRKCVFFSRLLSHFSRGEHVSPFMRWSRFYCTLRLYPLPRPKKIIKSLFPSLSICIFVSWKYNSQTTLSFEELTTSKLLFFFFPFLLRFWDYTRSKNQE